MSRDQGSTALYLSRKHFNAMSCGMIRNQRSKIRRPNTNTTARAHLEKSRYSSAELFSTLVLLACPLNWFSRGITSLYASYIIGLDVVSVIDFL